MRRSIRLLRIAFISCVVLAGCGGDSRPVSTPTAPSPQPTPQPAPQPTPQTATVSGVVSEVIGDKTVPLEGAHVEDSERHFSVKTGADGSYTIKDAVMTQYGGAYIYFAKAGYRSQVRIVPLTGDNIRLDVTLVRE